jgi:hypothetical protein
VINSLELVLKLNSRRSMPEYFVTERVFEQVLAEKNRAKESLSGARYNKPYDSSTFRFCHKVSWNGMTFICLSQLPILHSNVLDCAHTGDE